MNTDQGKVHLTRWTDHLASKTVAELVEESKINRLQTTHFLNVASSSVWLSLSIQVL